MIRFVKTSGTLLNRKMAEVMMYYFSLLMAVRAELRWISRKYVPSGMLFKLVEHSQVAVFKDEMKLLFTSKHFNQVDQVGVLQLLLVITVNNNKQIKEISRRRRSMTLMMGNVYSP